MSYVGLGSALCWLMFLSCSVEAGLAMAQAERERIVLLSTDAELNHAAHHALGPTLALRVVEEAAWTAPEAIARDEAATMLFWLVRDDRGGELRAYDAQRGRWLDARRITARPLDAAAAAALVLSIKTLLQQRPNSVSPPPSAAPSQAHRARQAPPSAAPPRPVNASPPANAAAPAGVEVSSAGAQRPAVRADGAATAGVDPARTLPREASKLVRIAPVDADGGPQSDRALLSSAADARDTAPSSWLDARASAFAARLERRAQLRVGVGLSLWPARGALGAWGVGLDIDAGPSVALDAPAVRARAWDGAAAASLLWRLAAASRWRIELGTGARLHLLRLWGDLGSSALATDVLRLMPGIGGSLRFDYAIAASLYVGLWGYAGWLVGAQRYFVDDARVHDSDRWRLGVGLGAAWSLR